MENSLKNSKPVELKLDWATHEAAKYACKNWHYSKTIPANKTVKVGVWEDDKFIGCVVFGCGATAYLGKSYGAGKQQVCELVRVALNKHRTPVSRILRIAISFLKRHNPGLRLIVSFADCSRGHHGGIYQATNWIYTGLTQITGPVEHFIGGKWVHPRTVQAKFGASGRVFAAKNNIPVRKCSPKHRYLFPLDDDMRKTLSPLSIPYPKRAVSKENVASGFQSEGGGANPTTALQNHMGFQDSMKIKHDGQGPKETAQAAKEFAGKKAHREDGVLFDELKPTTD